MSIGAIDPCDFVALFHNGFSDIAHDLYRLKGAADSFIKQFSPNAKIERLEHVFEINIKGNLLAIEEGLPDITNSLKDSLTIAELPPIAKLSWLTYIAFYEKIIAAMYELSIQRCNGGTLLMYREIATDISDIANSLLQFTVSFSENVSQVTMDPIAGLAEMKALRSRFEECLKRAERTECFEKIDEESRKKLQQVLSDFIGEQHSSWG